MKLNKEKLKQIFPPLGMRIIKTSIALLAAMLFSDLVIKRYIPGLQELSTVSVCVFAVLSVQDTVQGTRKFVLERVFGNLIGMASGFLFLFLFTLTGISGLDGDLINGNIVFFLFVAVGTLLTIYLCKAIHRATVSAVTIIVFLNIMFGAAETVPYGNATPYFKGALVVLQMTLGILIAVTINLLILRPKPKKTPEELKEEPKPEAQINDIEH